MRDVVNYIHQKDGSDGSWSVVEASITPHQLVCALAVLSAEERSEILDRVEFFQNSVKRYSLSAEVA